MFQGRKLVTMMLSLLAAVVLWLYVVTSVAPEATTRVTGIPVTVDGSIALEERGLIITQQDVETVTLELNTSRMNLAKLNAASIKVSVDASRIREAGEYDLTCSVTFPDTVRANDVDILRKSAESVHITVSQLDTRPMPVQLEWTGAVKDGYLFEAESTSIDPAEILVTGPKDEIDQIEKAVIRLDVSDLEQTELRTEQVAFVNGNGEDMVFSDLVSFSAQQATVTLPVSRTKEISLKLNLVGGRGITPENAKVTLEYETIRVKGTSDIIQALDDEYLLGTVDLSTITDKAEFSYNITLPAGVTNISGETTVTATVEIVGVTTQTISVSDIRLIHAPAGYQTEASTRTVQVTVRGGTAEVRELQESGPNGIYVLVDLQGYTQTGAFTVSGRVINETHPNVGVVESVEIGVVISAIEEPNTAPETED